MTDTERTILNHYNLNTPFPAAWPTEKIDSDDEDEEDEIQLIEAKPKTRARAKSSKSVRRYTTLGHRPGTSSSAAWNRPRAGTDAIVQKDEADPLGGPASVVSVLRHRGLPVEDDLELKNRFLLSSTTFNPTMYLSEVHKDASTDALLRGLGMLSQSIEQKSASLKVLVESNFERFVRAKATIDNVYTEMRNHGADQPASNLKPHSRQSSRQQNAHFRNPSANSVSLNNAMNDKRKHALIKESEYGILGVKNPLLDATAKAEEVWGPSLGGQEREDNLKAIVDSIEKNRNILDTGCAVEDCIKRRDYESLADEFARVQRYTRDARTMADRARQNQVALTDAQVYQMVISARVWQDVTSRVEEFKRETWKRLTDSNFSKGAETTSDNRPEEFMELIGVLLQLGVDDNPIWVWLLNRWDYLKKEITRRFEGARVQLEIQRRRLAREENSSTRSLAIHLKAGLASKGKDTEKASDQWQIIDFWEKQHSMLSGLLSTKNGLLAEVIEFWEIIQSFMDGVRQRSLPIGIDGQSRHHHNISPDGQKDLQDGIIQLFDMIRNQLSGWFTEAPLEDVSSLYTPTASAIASPSSSTRFNFDPNSIPPPTPTSSDVRDNAAFWPPHSNSLSAATYLVKIMNSIGSAASEIAALPLVKTDGRLSPQLRTLVSEVRERSVSCISAAWLPDIEGFGELEDWTRSADRPEITNMPARYGAFQERIITQIQAIIYISGASNSSGSAEVVTPPSARQIDVLQKTFKHSLYRAFNGMLEHLTKSNAAVPANSNSNPDDDEALTAPAVADDGTGTLSNTVAGLTPGTRKLLTMSNINALKSEIIPGLLRTFESSFSTTEDSKPVVDALRQIRDRIFNSYVRPPSETLRRITHAGITDSEYGTHTANPSVANPADANDASPYVYTSLLQLVLVHTEVSRTTPGLIHPILQHLQDQLTFALIEAFKTRVKYSLGALKQATLDVEFIAQTLGYFTSEKASSAQSEIYVALDERTDNDARQKLQNGLPEMRAILKRLRESSSGTFGCFRRPKSGRKTG